MGDRLVTAVPCLLLVAACSSSPTPDLFVEAAAHRGINFSHENGAGGGFRYPELLHAGCALVDCDGDGLLDAYLVQGGSLPPRDDASAGGNRLYRNTGQGWFEDVTDTSGAADPGYGTGVAAADYDRDGDVDLYVTNLGRNTLYRNDGSGRFEDVTAAAGVGDPGYSTTAVFFDFDEDRDLDLYVANYIAWSLQIERPCYAPSGLRDYCSPGVYNRPQRDTLYRNEGDGTFVDVSTAAGIHAAAGTGLGVVSADFTGDGQVDLYVANDQMPNFLWVNQGDGTFREDALRRGCALNAAGAPEASMGLVARDFDDDGDPDLFTVHLDGETNTFYRNDGGHFRDVTDALGLGAVSRAWTGFGTNLFDYDCDGRLDVFIANGRVRLGDTMEAGRYAEPNQLLRGTDRGTFEDVSAEAGSAFALLDVSRGAAFGDVDNDGDIDILINNNDGPARLLINEACGTRHWLGVELVGRSFDRHGIGSTVRIEAGGRRRSRRVQPAYSYGSSNDPRVHFGLGEIATVNVLVTWPDGRTVERRDVAADRTIRIEEPAR